MAQSAGHKVVVVSGGLEAYLEPWCDSHGVELICSSLQQSDGILTGRYEGRQCVLTEKARLVRERYDLATSIPTIYAYGDTPEDLDMLAIATKQYYQWQRVSMAAGANKWFDRRRSRRGLILVFRHRGSGDHRNLEPTIAEVLSVIERHLESTLLAVHLYGSGSDGGLKQFSDIDLLVTVAVKLDETTRRALLNDLMEASAFPGESKTLRTIEVTLVVHDDIIPWRYPAKRQLQFEIATQ